MLCNGPLNFINYLINVQSVPEYEALQLYNDSLRSSSGSRDVCSTESANQISKRKLESRALLCLGLHLLIE